MALGEVALGGSEYAFKKAALREGEEALDEEAFDAEKALCKEVALSKELILNKEVSSNFGALEEVRN